MPQQTDAAELELEQANRCEAETTVGGTPYRCSLEAEHEGEHSFQPVDETDDAETDDPGDEPTDDQRVKRLRKLMKGFEAELRDVLDADEPLTPVPMEGAIGFMVPGALDLRENDKFRRCPTCNGHGAVLTGSVADGQQTADCPRCGQRGYLERLPEQPASVDAAAANGNGDDDELAGFGVPKWMGDPNIGGGV